jgi:hypothetical protein
VRSPTEDCRTLGGVNILRVADLTHEHVGLRIRTGGHEGILGAITHRDDEWSQLLLLVEGMPPLLPIVGAGAPVDLID